MMQGAMMAHINEHVAFEYRKQMEMEMGVELPFHPDEDDEDERQIPEDMEVQISQLAARASQALLQRDTMEARAKQAQQAQQQAQQQQQDPRLSDAHAAMLGGVCRALHATFACRRMFQQLARRRSA